MSTVPGPRPGVNPDPAGEWSHLFTTKAAVALALDSLARVDGYAGASVTALPGGGWRVVAHFAAREATEAGAAAGGGALDRAWRRRARSLGAPAAVPPRP